MSRSNYSLYENASTSAQRRTLKQTHETEIDTLTDLLVHSVNPSASDFVTLG